MITPSQIKDKVLSTASHGYDIDETNAFIAEIEESFSAIYDENKELYRKMEILAAKIEEYRAEEDSIKDTLLTAQKAASQVTKEAKDKADELLSESAQTVQKTVLDAKEKAEKIVSEAREYTAELTKEKTEAANAIISEASEKAEKEIHDAKADSAALLNEAKRISEELLTKAKEEKEYYESLTAKMKEEAESFKAQLVSLYGAQLEKLEDMMHASVIAEKEETEAKIDDAEKAMDEVAAQIEEIEQSISEESEIASDAAEEAEEDDADNASEEIEEIEEIEELEDTTEAENEQAEAESEIEYELEEISEDDFTEADVHTALDAFSQDTVTPVSEDAPIAEISEEPEMENSSADEEQLPFESFFNVKAETGRTDEKISLIPPDDEDDGEDLKFRGFFKKKRK